MGYLLLKALHLTAVFTWIGGMLAAAVVLGAGAPQRCAIPAGVFDHLRTWDRRVTTPAMLLAWIIGLALALLGHWFPQGWLIAKLAFVLLLSGLHGVLAGQLRRLASEPAAPVRPMPGHAAAVVLATAIIAVIVVVKPHGY
ncbi:hypothetical protein GJ697_28960 [Pseudoduganella sp. FT25W]|uniref:Protoporphyrinogen IX oxidase n=1 Tax=Duganella alba TaxID=2666081 RepID=A0A6L5QQ96_9BURK|nr:CopD family protein [Duganella alba]MRX11867.1 hypothetical protein [Duganella alba]MRX20250.1 hypothetical protein [Duganella alba]